MMADGQWDSASWRRCALRPFVQRRRLPFALCHLPFAICHPHGPHRPQSPTSSRAQQLAHALLGAERPLELAEDLGKGGHRAADEERVEREHRELPVRKPARLQQGGPVPHDQRHRPKDADDDERDQQGAPPDAAQRRLEIGRQPGTVALGFVALVGEGLHIGDALHRFLHDRGALGEAVLRFARNPPHFSPEQHRDEHEHGKGRHHDQRQSRRNGDDRHAAAEQHHRLAQGLRHGAGQRVAPAG